MREKKHILTGITTTGTPHLGNYVGAIRPAIEASHTDNVLSFFFLANYHALIKCWDPERIRQSTLEIAATWLAFGLDPAKTVFYRQSDVPEIFELHWILSCVTAKGVMNRAHAYKAAVDMNQEAQEDPDHGITMGLFEYPILMAADILLFHADSVPVGFDQVQHIEMARDIALRFNHLYGDCFTIPAAHLQKDMAVLQGLDGRKMSKSYNNTIPVLCDEKTLKNLIMKIKTNSLLPGEPKDPNDSILFDLYRAFAGVQEVEQMRVRYQEGIAWGEMKKILFECLNEQLQEPRNVYQSLLKSPGDIENILKKGAEKAREYSVPFIKRIREVTGITGG